MTTLVWYSEEFNIFMFQHLIEGEFRFEINWEDCARVEASGAVLGDVLLKASWFVMGYL